jgi:hypothetical protein
VIFRVRRSGAAVPAFPLGAGDWHVAPGEGGELGVQAGLVALDDQQVVRSAAVQVSGVGALGVQRVGGDDRAGDLDTVQQRAEHRDLVGLGGHVHLPEHHAMGMVKGGKQVTAVLAAMARAA